MYSSMTVRRWLLSGAAVEHEVVGYPAAAPPAGPGHRVLVDMYDKPSRRPSAASTVGTAAAGGAGGRCLPAAGVSMAAVAHRPANNASNLRRWVRQTRRRARWPIGPAARHAAQRPSPTTLVPVTLLALRPDVQARGLNPRSSTARTPACTSSGLNRSPKPSAAGCASTCDDHARTRSVALQAVDMPHRHRRPVAQDPAGHSDARLRQHRLRLPAIAAAAGSSSWSGDAPASAIRPPAAAPPDATQPQGDDLHLPTNRGAHSPAASTGAGAGKPSSEWRVLSPKGPAVAGVSDRSAVINLA